jgi:hypothetical protein
MAHLIAVIGTIPYFANNLHSRPYKNLDIDLREPYIDLRGLP